MKTVNGWAFPSADRFMATEMKANGEYQAGHLSTALKFVTDWSVAVSCGAHVGTWTKLLSARFARVIAVEPARDTFEALQANMQTFGCRNVDCLNIAVGATRGLVSMVIDERGASLANTGARYTTSGGAIPREVIDEWNLPTLGFLKLDIEGSEADAIKGAAATLQRCRPIVLWENKGFCRRFGYAKDAPQAILTSLGYHEVAIAGCDRIWAATP